MKGERVVLTAEKETLLPTLYGRALDSRSANPILGDTWADDVVRRLDYDFAKMKMPKGAEISLPIRAKHFDGWTRQFLAAHANATVLHLGCGLDSRVFRVDPPPTVRWFDVDQAEVIALRRRVYPERAGYEMIATSVTDLAWLERVPADAPVFVVGEGLLIYLPEDAGLALLGAITARFPSGELAFDVYSRAMVWLTRRLPAVKKTGAVLHWGIDDSHALERAVPRLRLVDDVPFLTMPEMIERSARTRFQRAVSGLLARSAFVKKLVRHVRYRF